MSLSKGELFADIALGIGRVSGLMQNLGDRTASGVGLTSARWSILGVLRRAGQPQTVPEIARSLGQARQGVQRIVNVMVTDGLVEYQENPGHITSKKVVLTAKGLEQHTSLRARQEKWSEIMAKDMTVEELKNLQRFLHQLIEKLDR